MSVSGTQASTILDDIINELKLTCDGSVGLLDGDNIRQVPNLNILLNLSKLLNNLSKELEETDQIDSKVIALIKGRIKEVDEGVNEQGGGEKKNNKRESSDNVEGPVKRQKIKTDNEHIIDGEEPETTLKSSKDLGDEDDMVEEEDDNQVGEEENEVEEENDEEEENEDDDEDDDAPLIKREKPKETVDVSTEESKESKDDTNGNEESQTGEGSLNSVDDPVPPVQTGHYTQENDTRLKNPKSEFVTSQTISSEAIAELGLFSEDNNGLETQGKEYLKKKYGVASYPENDLKDLLPGEIPNVDFSKNKPPSNQVQFTTFQSYIESFYRPFGAEDLKFLNEKYITAPGFERQNYDPDVSPYIIPKLGRFYADVWADEDSNLANKLNNQNSPQTSIESYRPKGSIDDLNDDTLYTEDISCGPLSSRLLSAVLSIHEETTNDEDKLDDKPDEGIVDDGSVATQLSKTGNETYELSTETTDFYSIEERLKRELKYIGIFMNLSNEDDDKDKLSINGRSIKTEGIGGSIIDNDDWIKNKEDDEVSAEIRQLQKELKEAAARNRLNKKKLIPLVEEQIAYQEYCTILEDLDKQVDQAYMKRLKSRGKKKKTEKVEPSPAQQQAMNTSIRSLLDKRKRWIENIGKLFKPPELMKRVPSQSVLEGESLDDEPDDDANDVAQDVIQEKT